MDENNIKSWLGRLKAERQVLAHARYGRDKEEIRIKGCLSRINEIKSKLSEAGWDGKE